MAEMIPKTEYLRKLAPDIEVLDYLEKFAAMNPTAFNANHIYKDVFYYDENVQYDENPPTDENGDTPPVGIKFPPNGNGFKRWLIHYENKKNSENTDTEVHADKQPDDEFCEFTENSEKYAVLICDDPTDDNKKMTISGISFLSGVAF